VRAIVRAHSPFSICGPWMQISPGMLRPRAASVFGSTTLSSALRTTVRLERGALRQRQQQRRRHRHAPPRDALQHGAHLEPRHEHHTAAPARSTVLSERMWSHPPAAPRRTPARLLRQHHATPFGRPTFEESMKTSPQAITMFP
jgi:hypothetical protein